MKGLDGIREGADVDDILEEVVTARRAGTDPKELFGGPRDWVDSMVPPLAFVAAAVWFKTALSTAVYLALGAVLVLVVIRLVSRETLRHAFSGVAGVGISALFVWRLGEAKAFFLPGIFINVAYGGAFLLSVLLKHPLVGVIMRAVFDRPKEWHDHPQVRRAYAEATLGWALVFLLRVAVQGILYKLDQAGWLAAAKIAMGYPLYLSALALTVPYVKWRAREVPVPESAPEGEAEAGGEDAAGDAAEPVADGSGA